MTKKNGQQDRLMRRLAAEERRTGIGVSELDLDYVATSLMHLDCSAVSVAGYDGSVTAQRATSAAAAAAHRTGAHLVVVRAYRGPWRSFLTGDILDRSGALRSRQSEVDRGELWGIIGSNCEWSLAAPIGSTVECLLLSVTSLRANVVYLGGREDGEPTRTATRLRRLLALARRELAPFVVEVGSVSKTRS